jgi:hypothetical protein
MWKSAHEKVRRENYTLRDALREANQEILKHRRLLAEIQEGRGKTLEVLDRMMRK